MPEKDNSSSDKAPPKALPVEENAGKKEVIPKATIVPEDGKVPENKDTKSQKTDIEVKKVELQARKEILQKKQSEVVNTSQKKHDEDAAQQDLLSWSDAPRSPSSPSVSPQKSQPLPGESLLVKQKSPNSVELSASQKQLQVAEESDNAQEKFSESLRGVHKIEMAQIAERGDPGALARAQIYRELLEEKGRATSLDTKIQADTQDADFAKKTPEEQIKIREQKKQDIVNTFISRIETYQQLLAKQPPASIDDLKPFATRVGIKDIEKYAGTPDELKKQIQAQLSEQIGGGNIDTFLDSKKIKDTIVGNIDKKGILASEIPLDSPLGKELTDQQKKTLEEYIKTAGEDFKLDELPMDIRQRLIFEDPDNDTSTLVGALGATIPEKMQRDIVRTRREMFRQKEGEDDQSYKERVGQDFEKNTGMKISDIDRGKISPLIRFLADLLAPFGAMMSGPSGDFWRQYMQDNGTPEQQKRWSDNAGEYYGKEGGPGRIEESSRKGYEENLTNYQGSTHPELSIETSKMQSNQSRYEAVAKRLQEKGKNVPWEVIAAIHYREGSGNFGTYLHNGDRLGKPTRNVPKGINFNNWEDAAVDAIAREQFFPMDITTKEGLVNIAAYAESYNGPAYKNKGKNSPYVWAGSSGVGVAGLIKKDHGPITNQQDKRLGIMPIVLELAGYTRGGNLTDKYKQLISQAPKQGNELAGKDPVGWFKKEAEKGTKYGNGEGKYDCMTSTNTALGLPWEHLRKTFGGNYILGKNEKGEDKSQDLWGVSMAAAVYTGFLSGPTSSSSDKAPIQKGKDGWYGGSEKANNPSKMEYFIEENIMNRVNNFSDGMMDVGDKHNLIHYSKKKKRPEGIVEDIKTRLKDGETAMMGATGKGTNVGGHEWLVAREGENLMVYESSNHSSVNGVSGKGRELSEYLSDSRRSQYTDEAIIFAKKG